MYKAKPVIRILNDHQGNVSATVSIDDIDYKVITNIIGLSPKARDARIRALAWSKHAKSIVKPEQVWVHKPLSQPCKLSKGPS